MVLQSIWHIFPERTKEIFVQALQCKDLEEIRLRAGKPAYIVKRGREYFIDSRGCFTNRPEEAKYFTQKEIKDVINQICQYSLYAYEDELRCGYLTIPGGHRVGITGEVVLGDTQTVKTMKYINGINIRISHEIKGVADTVLPYIYERKKPLNTVIISPPGCGKTTLLRDMIRQISDGNNYGEGICVGVVDERSEIAGAFQGCPQNDVGIRTDVLDACPKDIGIMMLIRAMAPKMVAIDELGKEEEWKALFHAAHCGVGMLASMHGCGPEDFDHRCKTYLPQMEGMFRRCIVLRKNNGQCMVGGIYQWEEGGMWKCICLK